MSIGAKKVETVRKKGIMKMFPDMTLKGSRSQKEKESFRHEKRKIRKVVCPWFRVQYDYVIFHKWNGSKSG